MWWAAVAGEKGAVVEDAGVEVVVVGVEDDADGGELFVDETEGDAEGGKGVDEVCCAVDGVDDEGWFWEEGISFLLMMPTCLDTIYTLSETNQKLKQKKNRKKRENVITKNGKRFGSMSSAYILCRFVYLKT